MDFRTAWKVIAKKLGDDKRALILAKLAELFSCGAVAVEFDPKAPPEVLPSFSFFPPPRSWNSYFAFNNCKIDPFVEMLVGRLWAMTGDAHPMVRRAAFKTLTQYARCNLDNLGKVTTETYVRLLQGSDKPARKAAQVTNNHS